jgi:hypothetical protein
MTFCLTQLKPDRIHQSHLLKKGNYQWGAKATVKFYSFQKDANNNKYTTNPATLSPYLLTWALSESHAVDAGMAMEAIIGG